MQGHGRWEMVGDTLGSHEVTRPSGRDESGRESFSSSYHRRARLDRMNQRFFSRLCSVARRTDHSGGDFSKNPSYKTPGRSGSGGAALLGVVGPPPARGATPVPRGDPGKCSSPGTADETGGVAARGAVAANRVAGTLPVFTRSRGAAAAIAWRQAFAAAAVSATRWNVR